MRADDSTAKPSRLDQSRRVTPVPHRFAGWLAGIAAAVVGSLGIAGSTYHPDLTIPSDLEGRSFELQGTRLRVQTEGSGRDVLMIHGSSGSLEDFTLQVEELSTAFRVTRYDRPGHGLSGETDHPSRTHHAELALALIERLGLERVVVVGHSYGGSTALGLGLLHSPRVASIVVIDSLIYPSESSTPLIYRIASLPVLGPGLARILPRSVLEQSVEDGLRAVFRAAPPPPGFLELRRRLWAEPKVIHALARERVGANADLARFEGRYDEIDVPVYLAVQRDDPLRREQASRLVRERPGTVVEAVAETGHYIQFERPEIVTALIRRAAEESAIRAPEQQGP
jgi:pimeloyl-ACP methyl ester carboxylesterase